MKDMFVSCQECGYSDICKIPESNRDNCKLHNEIEHQYWKKTRVIGGLSMKDINRMQGR
jgi:hypothetical protein